MKVRTIVPFIFVVLMLPLSVAAQDLPEPHKGTSMDCAARWHFVHNQVDAEEGVLIVDFQNAGTVFVESEDHKSKNLHYIVETSSADILLDASDNIEGGKLVLSDVKCVEVPTTTTTTTPPPTTTTTTTPPPTTTTTTTPPPTTTTTTTPPPTTTTTTVPPTSTTTTTSTTIPPTTTTTAPPPILPETGIDTFGLAFAGLALAVLGTTVLLASNAPEVAFATKGRLSYFTDKAQKSGRHMGKGGLKLSPLSLFKKGRHMA